MINLIRGQKFILGLIFASHIGQKLYPSLQFFILPCIPILMLSRRVSLIKSASPRMEDDSSEDIVDFVYFYLTGKGYPSNCTSSMKRQIFIGWQIFMPTKQKLIDECH